jgi:hypothetical protein
MSEKSLLGSGSTTEFPAQIGVPSPFYRVNY